MKSVGMCPRCKASALAEWLDGDTSCWVCGHVVYTRALVPDDDFSPGQDRRAGPRVLQKVGRRQLLPR